MSQSSSVAQSGPVNFAREGNPWIIGLAIVAAAVLLGMVLFKKK